ncbi:MAG: hypothetical protein JOY59_12935 [Candidatus Eremiobacteraeota bacterium]|nr:hypothetical protein [Candidatus Eremiobacteraeota bacterium]
MQLDKRLGDDADTLRASTPDGYSLGDWEETLANLVAADSELVDQVVGSVSPFSLQPGLHERLIRSAQDSEIDAVAIYEPAPPLRAVAIALHGNPQTESEFLAQPYLRRLADETHTAIIAPYGRGAYDFRGPATADLYGLLLLVKKMPELASLPFYLVGYSMGGFTAYMIGPSAPIVWSGVLDVSGALVGSAVPAVLKHWPSVRIYEVHGQMDTSIPTRFSHDTVVYLFSSGFAVSYYEEPGAGHFLRLLVPSLTNAWLDMHQGIVRDGEAAGLAREAERHLPGGFTPPAPMGRP